MIRSRVAALSALLIACAPPSAAAQTTATAGAVEHVQPPTGLRDDAARLLQPNNDARRDALLAMLRERGHEPSLQAVPNPRQTDDPRREGANVVLTFGRGARDLVIGAHFDAVHFSNGAMSAGMVDNAAGSVVVARIADALRERQHELRHRVHVVLFDLEEEGLLGSRRFVATLDSGRVAAMVNLDIAGYGDAVIFGPASHAGNEQVYGAMWERCARARRSCIEFAQYPSSDDRSFQAAGIPNISVAVLPRVEAHQMWLMIHGGAESGLVQGFRPRIMLTIHSREDRLERLEEPAMQLAYQAVLELILHLDQKLP